MIIKLADGTLLENLTMNGNNYVSKTKIDPAVFEGNLDTLEIDGEPHENMKLVQCKQYGNEWWFILAPKTEIDILREENINLMVALADLYEVVYSG